MGNIGLFSLTNILISIFSIILCFRVLQNVQLETILKVKKPAQLKALIILLSIILGHNLAGFIIDYLNWTRLMGQIFY